MGCSESDTFCKDANNLKPKLQFQVNDKYVTDSLEVANSL